MGCLLVYDADPTLCNGHGTLLVGSLVSPCEYKAFVYKVS
jgi:hypothetical protein